MIFTDQPSPTIYQKDLLKYHQSIHQIPKVTSVDQWWSVANLQSTTARLRSAPLPAVRHRLAPRVPVRSRNEAALRKPYGGDFMVISATKPWEKPEENHRNLLISKKSVRIGWCVYEFVAEFLMHNSENIWQNLMMFSSYHCWRWGCNQSLILTTNIPFLQISKRMSHS